VLPLEDGTRSISRLCLSLKETFSLPGTLKQILVPITMSGLWNRSGESFELSMDVSVVNLTVFVIVFTNARFWKN
jgi:hypothetical protein